MALSGLTALGVVVWTRLLSLLLGATVYAFSIILALFLAGLWAGSGIGSFFVRRIARPSTALSACQLLLALSVAWTAYTQTIRCRFGRSIPGCRSIRGSTSSWTWRAVPGPSFRRHSGGALVFPWQSQPRRRRDRTRGGSRELFTPQIPEGQS